MPNVQRLEDRRLLAAVPVTNTFDSGPGSLRDAIGIANASTSPSEIVFNIPASDPGFIDVDAGVSGGDVAPDAFRISLLSPLPTITSDDVLIDGGSQSVFGGDTNPFGPEVILDGSGAGTAYGLIVNGSRNQITGLNMQHWHLAGIAVENGANNWISGNYLGTDAVGVHAAPNGDGITLFPSAIETTVGTNGDGINDADEWNLLSGNIRGVFLIGSNHNTIAGNRVGTNREGTSAIPNSFGIELAGTQYNTIGTDGDGVADDLEGNLVSGNVGWNIRAEGAIGTVIGNHYSVFAGNIIGLDLTGTVSLGGAFNSGFDLTGSHNRVGTNGDGVSDNLERNVISGNSSDGLLLRGPLNQQSLLQKVTTGNVIAGNYIGTDVSGTIAIGNGINGILVTDGASANLIGTDADGNFDDVEGNVISGNSGTGIYFSGIESEDNVVAGNLIGIDVIGENPLANNGGVGVSTDLKMIRIGTNGDGVHDAAEANEIAYNNGSGVTVSGSEVSIRGNSIHSNSHLGIDLGPNGVTANDPLDADTGPNGYMNFPAVQSASAGAATRVIGDYHGLPNQTFLLDFYASEQADPSGHGEGRRYLGASQITTDSAGNAAFSVLLASATTQNEFVSATATDLVGSTSEFSKRIVVEPADTLTVEIDVQQETVNVGENGVIPVVLFTTDDFDASNSDISSITFAGAHVYQSAFEDVDDDGDLDLVLHFRAQDTALAALYAELVEDDIDGDGILDSRKQIAEVSLLGKTTTDDEFEGADSVDLLLSGRKLRELLDALFANS